MSIPYGKFRRCDATRLYLLADDSADLVIGSPPYFKRRSYGIGAQRGLEEWVRFMLACTREGLRVSKGLVVWVVGGCTEGGAYWPGCEALLYEAWKAGIVPVRPVIWHKVDENGGGTGTPGSGGKQGLRNDWEYCLIFKKTRGPLPFADPTFEKRAPKCKPGGKIRNRQVNGSRSPKEFKQPQYVNPGDVLRARVGGGHMGDRMCSLNEAPFPEKVPAFFIQAYSPIGGLVVDPFSGSGTSVVEAVRHGRNGLGTDLRESQVRLGRRRLAMRRALLLDARHSLRNAPEEGVGDVA